jgi:hypothetical protein
MRVICAELVRQRWLQLLKSLHDVVTMKRLSGSGEDLENKPLALNDPLRGAHKGLPFKVDC